ncbi:hypothetical protein F511_05432 [Dorcoceras hygrometricum]|uniref:Uncharacterized protein n=1 Tax=Dorcoceras hygrometricum TaxID=472368 RepID=A0A2Z7BIR2_9LAMI|nr:hypothetical protein F511_05432 [Dorcoceras hygrometricum]
MVQLLRNRLFPPMAAPLSSISIPLAVHPFGPYEARKHPSAYLVGKLFLRPVSTSLQAQLQISINPWRCSASAAAVEDGKLSDELAFSIDVLHRFIELNLGNWIGSFYVNTDSSYCCLITFSSLGSWREENIFADLLRYELLLQFDFNGNLLHKISTRLAVSSYGEGELRSLIQSLYIKQPPLSASSSEDESEWFEYKIKETNMFTVDKYQQIGFFPKEKAFALRYQTAGMLETVIRQGVLGEDDTGEESPRNLKLPSRRPAIVCENCLFSLELDARVRAFHIMDPKGILDMLIVFLEERDSKVPFHPTLDDAKDRISPHLGTWKGHSITKRSGVYGFTIAEADTIATLEMNVDGQLIQDIKSTSDNKDATSTVNWKGSISDNLITFDGGYQMTLLPGGMYMGFPTDVSKSVQESKSFHLELCWLELPGTRQRLVRTYDMEGLAVSSTYILETRQ